MAEPIYFQWQNEILRQTIYPMREVKLRDFLVHYAEADIWKQYHDRTTESLQAEIQVWKAAQARAAEEAYRAYLSLRAYFLTPNVRSEYAQAFHPPDEAEMTEINRLHSVFVDNWPKDIRGERNFVDTQTAFWVNHCKLLGQWIASRVRRLENMLPDHPNYTPETQELRQKQDIALPMAERELERLRAFLKTYDKVETRKLEWYRLSKSDPSFDITEDVFMRTYTPARPASAYDIAVWKIEEYKASLQDKNQYELLEEIYQRFQKEPERFPRWLQYMVVHFSGMRYASAHSSWADPKDLLVRLRAPAIEAEIKNLDDATVEKLCQEKIAAYESAGGIKPKLATSTEKEWRDKIGWYLPSLKANSIGTKRYGLMNLRKVEDAYEVRDMSTQQALDILLSKKKEFPAWAWKQIVALTPLRTTQVADAHWEKLTPQEEQERLKPEYAQIRSILDAWQTFDPSAWREEHGRSHELIVTRAVCNETAEHIQHLRGHLPPGGLAARPGWYVKHESENEIPGSPRPFYKRPKSAQDYVPGASILWLRFTDEQPNAWQIAKQVKSKDGTGLLPAEFGTKGGMKATKADAGKGRKGEQSGASPWQYKIGETITRTRTLWNAQGQKTTQRQWLRWIHEATVVEVAEMPDGPFVITFETALPDEDKATSCIGIFKKPLAWHLSDGTEEAYNRSFVGFVPEGQTPVEHLNAMLDWNKILRRQIT